jgi:general secretion pathway protein D
MVSGAPRNTQWFPTRRVGCMRIAMPIWTSSVRVVLGTMVFLLMSCSSPLKLAGIGPKDSADLARFADFTALYPPKVAKVSNDENGRVQLRSMIFPGSGRRSTSSAHQAGISQSADTQAEPLNPPGYGGGNGVFINFSNADVQTIAKSILSDTLGLNVAIDPRVRGNVTIMSSSPIPKQELFATFENIMSMMNASVIRDGSVVRIIPVAETGGSAPLSSRVGSADGFGFTVIPLRYTSADSVAKTVQNFLSKPNSLRVDRTRNLILVQGSAAERESVVEFLRVFDVEWLRDQSVGIYPLKSTSPDIMIRELDRIFQTEKNEQGNGIINFQPITRMNAVLAVARNRKAIAQASMWITRLDRSDPSSVTARFYKLDNNDAMKVATILNEVFVGEEGATGDSAASQLAPGAKSNASKLNSLNAGSSNEAASDIGATDRATTSGGSSAPFDQFSAISSDKKKGGNDANAANGSGASPQGMFPNVRITADPNDNAIIIFSNQDDYLVIANAIRELDRPQQQVEIQATIAEVTLTDELQYGVQYYLGSSTVGGGSNHGSISLSTSSASALISQSLPGLNVLLGSQGSPNVVLSALSSLTCVKVHSIRRLWWQTIRRRICKWEIPFPFPRGLRPFCRRAIRL